MVQFKDIFQTESTSQHSLTAEEAVAAIVMVAVYADGQPSAEEYEEASNIINTLDIFEDYSADQFQKMLGKIDEILQEEGIGVLFHTAIDSISDSLVETALEASAEAVLIDWKVAEEEESFLYKLAEALDISHDVAQDIIEGLANQEAY